MRILLLITAILWSSFSWADSPYFVKNNGQWNQQAIAKADIPGGAIFLENKAITYHFIDQNQLAHAHDKYEVWMEISFILNSKISVKAPTKSNIDKSKDNFF